MSWKGRVNHLPVPTDLLSFADERRPIEVSQLNLKSCLTPEEVAMFLRGRFTQKVPSLPVVAAPGRTYIGLKTFVAERSASIQKQLAGTQPSAGDGSGNGGSVMMFNRQERRPNNPQPEDQPAKGGKQ